MASTIGSLGTTAAADQATGAAASKTTQDVSKETFMQLLVAQIKNQNPLNPTDGVQFLTQLAQFSELEQLIDIRTDISKIADSVTAEPPESPAATGAQ